jgi:hypothetical protein
MSNPQSLNRYSYVRNNPINFNDPTGHMEENDDGGGVTQATCQKSNNCTPPPSGGKGGGNQHRGSHRKGTELISSTQTNWLPIGPFQGSPWACEWIDCTLSTVSVVASAVATFTLEAVPAIALVAEVVDVGATIWSMIRTQDDYDKGKISDKRWLALQGTSVVGLVPIIPFGIVAGLANMAFTFSGTPP